MCPWPSTARTRAARCRPRPAGSAAGSSRRGAPAGRRPAAATTRRCGAKNPGGPAAPCRRPWPARAARPAGRPAAAAAPLSRTRAAAARVSVPSPRRSGEAEAPARPAVAVPGVDHRLGRPQDRQRLAPLPHVGQLTAHQAVQHAPPPVRGQHRDERHARRPAASRAGHAQLEAEAHRDADLGRARRRPPASGRTRSGRGSCAGRPRSSASRGRRARRPRGRRRARSPR